MLQPLTPALAGSADCPVDARELFGSSLSREKLQQYMALEEEDSSASLVALITWTINVRC